MNLVREIRKDLEMTQEEFGKLLGISRRQIINQEQDRTELSKSYKLLLLCIKQMGESKFKKLEKEIE